MAPHDARSSRRRNRSVEQAHLANVKSVGEGVLEYPIDWGPGYRIYLPPRRPKWISGFSSGTGVPT
jgi:putative component of toxin-antitoxin plasmid stabilization module